MVRNIWVNAWWEHLIALVVQKMAIKLGMSSQAQESIHSPGALKRKLFYALRSRGDQEEYPVVFTGMLQVLSIYVYTLLDPGDTLSFLTPLVAKKFIL